MGGPEWAFQESRVSPASQIHKGRVSANFWNPTNFLNQHKRQSAQMVSPIIWGVCPGRIESNLATFYIEFLRRGPTHTMALLVY